MTQQIRPISFREALSETADRRRHLLMGNGFSIAAHRGFDYSSLYDVEVAPDPSLSALFDELGTKNFEVALKQARNSREAEEIRARLISAVAKVHPTYGMITEEARGACGLFLEDFTAVRLGGQRGSLFTTNYDLLLYWVLVQHNKTLKCYDGFDSDGVWAPFREARLFYLHGGLHIFEHHLPKITQVKKLMWQKGRSLIQQVQSHLEVGDLPLFISEGNAIQKRARRWDSEYLKKALRHFTMACDQADSVLFTVGHSLSDADAHIADAIGGGQIERVFLGAYGPADHERFSQLGQAWAAQRAGANRPEIEVCVFDVSECPIWRSEIAVGSASIA